ncbi:hypothetical protein KKG41_06850 [Patescibacteria group bacterium]|nr:hypothetical protein [Patescibacteria group bacterium]MBU1890993.1 hypothetical protein [Patescibacteria group bacterium]
MFIKWLKKKISTSANIVETVDVLARSYMAMRIKNPLSGNSEIYKKVVDFRYDEIPIKETKKMLITSQLSDNLPFEGFAWSVLKAELNIHETPKDFQEMALNEIRTIINKYKGLS